FSRPTHGSHGHPMAAARVYAQQSAHAAPAAPVSVRSYFPHREPEPKEITALLARLRHRWAEALNALWLFGGLELPICTANAALAAHSASSSAWRSSLALLRLLGLRSSTRDVRDVVSYSSSAVSLERRSKWTAVLILLQELTRARLQRDLLSDAVAISACGLGHAWPRAEGLVAELRSRSLRVNSVVATSILSSTPWRRASACAEGLSQLAAPALARAYRSWQVAVDSSPITTIQLNAAVTRCANAAQWHCAQQLLQEASAARVVYSAEAQAPARAACVAAGGWTRGLQLLEGAAQTVYVLAAALSWATWPAGLMLFRQVSQGALQLDLTTLNSALALLDHSSWPQALELLRTSSAEELRPDVLSWQGVCSTLGETCPSSSSPQLLVALEQLAAAGLADLAVNDVITANAGDSRAVMCRKGQAVELSYDHKPASETEKTRIEAAGGYLEESAGGARVNGNLNLSRAIGDLEYKKRSDLKPE
ncbi:Protein phosphatase ppm-1.G (Protein phosphatase 2C isoform gamma homolog) (PP2C-gamma) (Protein phosphatase magnesium-dependent 1 gamma homolog), partial [Durusdinium trenchii]